MESEHPHAGRLRQPRPAERFDATPSSLSRAAPLLGEHTDEVLRELGLSEAAVAELRALNVIG